MSGGSISCDIMGCEQAIETTKDHIWVWLVYMTGLYRPRPGEATAGQLDLG